MATTYALRSAQISQCGRYRYNLYRVWSPLDPNAVFIMLNPSTADGYEDDPTIRRCVSFAKAAGCGGIIVVNLYAIRTPKPVEIYISGIDPVGPDNDAYIIRAVRDASGPVIAAWGENGRTSPRSFHVSRIVPRPMKCLGTTKLGAPRHPLYVKGGQPLVSYGGAV